MAKFKCPICKKVYTDKVDLSEHIESKHSDELPQGWSGMKYIFFANHGRTTGKCIVCKHETSFNESTGKPNRLCSNPNCVRTLREKAKVNMLKVYNKETLLNDPEFQVKMLMNRKISKDYHWSDGKHIKRVVGSYEYDGMEKFDLFFNLDPEDVIVPAPFSIPYEFDNKTHFYIPDAYISSLNILVEFKDGGNNPNTHPKIQAIDKEKEKAKEEAIKKLNKYHYIKIANKEYDGFLELLIKLKNDESDIVDDDRSNMYIITEASTITDSNSLTEANHKLKPPKCNKCGSDNVGVYIKGEPVYICKDCNAYLGVVPCNLGENTKIYDARVFDNAPVEIVLFMEKDYPFFTEVGLLVNGKIYTTRTNYLTIVNIEDVSIEKRLLPLLSDRACELVMKDIDSFKGVWHLDDVTPINSPIILLYEILHRYEGVIPDWLSHDLAYNIFSMDYFHNNPLFKEEEVVHYIEENALKNLEIEFSNLNEDIDDLLMTIDENDFLNNTSDVFDFMKSALSEKALDTKARNELDDDDFGIPEKRKFPLIDKSHILMAIRYFYSCDLKYKKQLANRINKAARKLGLKVDINKANPFYKYADKHILKEEVEAIPMYEFTEGDEQFINMNLQESNNGYIKDMLHACSSKEQLQVIENELSEVSNVVDKSALMEFYNHKKGNLIF